MQPAHASIYPSQLIIVRHGESEMNVRKAIAMNMGNVESIMMEPIRDADVILTERGKHQALATGRGLRTHTDHIDVAYVSPFVRTMDTFRLIQEEIGYHIPMRTEDRVREREFGVFSQLTLYGIERHFPQEAQRLKLEGEYYYRPMGGESYPDMGLRLHSFLHSLYQHQSGKRVLVITHADVVQMIRKMLERLSEAELIEMNRSDDVINCGVTSYYYDPDSNYLKLHRYNQLFYER